TPFRPAIHTSGSPLDLGATAISDTPLGRLPSKLQRSPPSFECHSLYPTAAYIRFESAGSIAIAPTRNERPSLSATSSVVMISSPASSSESATPCTLSARGSNSCQVVPLSWLRHRPIPSA